MNMLSEMLEDGEGRLILAVIVGLVLFVVGAGIFLVKDDIRWRAYAAAHHCEQVSQDPGYYTVMPMTTVGPNNTVSTTIIPLYVEGARHYLCDGGERVTR